VFELLPQPLDPLLVLLLLDHLEGLFEVLWKSVLCDKSLQPRLSVLRFLRRLRWDPFDKLIRDGLTKVIGDCLCRALTGYTLPFLSLLLKAKSDTLTKLKRVNLVNSLPESLPERQTRASGWTMPLLSPLSSPSKS
jgi:hypothetical protein